MYGGPKMTQTKLKDLSKWQTIGLIFPPGIKTLAEYKKKFPIDFKLRAGMISCDRSPLASDRPVKSVKSRKVYTYKIFFNTRDRNVSISHIETTDRISKFKQKMIKWILGWELKLL